MSGNSKGGRSYNPEVTYSYSVLGSEYKKTISLGSRWLRSNAKSALAIVENNVDVRYKPVNPEENITDNERISANDILTVLTLWIIILFFLLVALFGYQGTPTTN